jgi:hypothetical protein
VVRALKSLDLGRYSLGNLVVSDILFSSSLEHMEAAILVMDLVVVLQIVVSRSSFGLLFGEVR